MIDTETTTDPSQRLLFGVWRTYVDRWDRLPGQVCREEGILYADDLPDRDPDGFSVLKAYAQTRAAQVFPGRNPRLRLLSRTEFVEQVLRGDAHRRHATVVGFNLPFDLSRLAIGWGKARGRFYGGISLRLWDVERYRPRIAYKTIDSKRALIGFTTPADADEKFRGHFLDLRRLCFALTDRGYTLERACDSFGVPYTKRDVTHGSISEEYITYCREDVGATARLFTAAVAEYRRHPIALQPTKAFSPASVGKAYEKEMGIRPILERQPDFDPHVLGWSMSAYFGGRAECRIRKAPLPVMYVDFLSMYPTVNALMGNWDLVTARRIVVDDATARVRRMLRSPDLFERCFHKPFWRGLACLVEIEPDGDILPVRAAFDPASADFGIGVNPYHFEGTSWYALADVVASVVLSGKVSKVRRAVELRPVGRQGGLRAVKIRGTAEVDPTEVDFFARVIELRHEVVNDPSYEVEERERLSAFLKVLANATSYGIRAEFVRQEGHEPVKVDVYTDHDTPFATKTETPEDRGPSCFPPLAACITAGARLMLALLERSVSDLGGSYVFCDTDSMGIVSDADGGLRACPGGPHQLSDGGSAVRALSWAEVDGIVERFRILNPYDGTVVPISILKIEKENFERSDPEGPRRQLWCWAISAKRYVLYTVNGNGDPVLRQIVDNHEEAGRRYDPVLAKASEHGLGHLLNPRNPDDLSSRWTDEAWAFMLRSALGIQVSEPPWLDRPALTRVTASSPTVLKWFNGVNVDKPYSDQIKPANFLLLAHPDPLDPSGALPIAPYESDASKWSYLPWIDRRNGEPIEVTTQPLDGHLRPGVVRVRTYREVLAGYLTHPEAKSLGPDGEAVRRHTMGLLRRRPVQGVSPFQYIGKEGNRLEDRRSGLIAGPDEYRTEYVDASRTIWSELVVRVLMTMDRTTVAETVEVDRRTLERWLFKGVIPRANHEKVLFGLAVDHSIRELKARGLPVPTTEVATLFAYARLW